MKRVVAERDKNTSFFFFYKITNMRRRRNHIDRV